MCLGFGAENQFENCFFLTSIYCVFCVLDFSIETLLDLELGRRRWPLHRSGRSQLSGEVGWSPSGIPRPNGAGFTGSRVDARNGIGKSLATSGGNSMD